MNRTILFVLLICLAYENVECRKTSKSRNSGSSRGSSKTNYKQPSPTSLSYPQPASAPKPAPSFSGWQEKPAQRAKTNTQSHSYPSSGQQSHSYPSSGQSHSNPSSGQQSHSYPSSGQSHSYPSSNTGLSGSTHAKAPSSSHQESVQKSSVPQSYSPVQSGTGQQSHGYPSSGGLSGSASGGGYPSQHGTGLSGNTGSGMNYPAQHGNSFSSGGVAPPPYSGSNMNRQQNVGNYPANNNYGSYNHPQGPPPPYSAPGYGGGGFGSYSGGHGGYGGSGYHYGSNTPGYFGGYGNRGFGGVSRSGSILKGVGVAGVGVGTLLTGLALWNLARSTGNKHHTVIYDNRGQPVAVAPTNGTADSTIDSVLGELVNCTLTITTSNSSEILAIPCAIATSFTPDAEVKEPHLDTKATDTTKCIVTVVTKTEKEYSTTIPCSTLLNTAAENNVTEPPILNGTDSINDEMVPQPDTRPPANVETSQAIQPDGPTALKFSTDTLINCEPEPGETRDPINPCFAVTHNLTVIPLESTTVSSTPGVA